MTEPTPTHFTTHLQALAAKHPSSAALLAPGRLAMSFGELAARARALGDQLAAWGIRRGDIVAWPTADRPTSALALATMPASATLALLNPGLTIDAYEALLRRLRPKAVASPAGEVHPIVEAARRLDVAEISVLSNADDPTGAFDLELSRSRASLEAAPAITPETLYITATSGTTGRPKLVPQRQDQLLAMARATGAFFALGPGDIAAHVTALHLSAGMRSSYMMSLLNGGAVNCLAEADVDAFMAAAERGDVTYMSASFAMYREILRRIESGRRVTPGRLRFLRVGAGRIEPEEIDRLAAAYGVPVVTGLASSEACMIAHQTLNASGRSRGSVGAPLATEVRIVDDQGRPAAQGDAGEIQVRGPQVFPGYFDDDELNRQAFVDGWFRTGDAAFVDDRGELHVVGRLNEVINRGGEKISPAEVDAVLRSLPGVRDAAAFAVPHPRLGEELVAAIVRAPDCALDSAEMIGRVRAKLGARRAPRRLWFIDALPRNEAGKVLRRMLPQHVGFDSAAPAAPPDAAPKRSRSPLEVALTGLWANALHLARVDPDEDFFMLGGDSLRGAQLLDEVRAVFGVDIPVDALFDDAGTVAAMARRIETARTTARERPPAIARRAAGATVPLSSTQARVWFLQRLEPGNTAYHEARLWRIDGELDVAALSAAITAVAARHSMLRTRFVSGALGPVQVIDAEPAATLDIVDFRDAPADTDGLLGEAVRAHATRPFDLEAATPLRWTLFRLGQHRYALLRVWHHILGDALSARLLQQEISDVYAAARAGNEITLPELPIEFADYAVWQNDEQSGLRFAPQLAYWQSRLADLPILALPTDFRRPPAQSFRGGSVTTTLPREAAETLKAVGRERGATSFVTFLAVFSALLSRLSGDIDFAIGTPVAGRTLPELNHLIGFLANTVVFRADVAGTPTGEELLARTRSIVRDALRNQDVPFKVIVDALAAPRDPSRNPLFQVAFAMREHDPVDMHFEGAQTRRIDSGIERAKFDLTLTLIERPDRIDARWEYCADLFQRATIERMSHQYATLVAAMAAAPAQTIATLPLMDAQAREKIAVDACRSSNAMANAVTIAERFAAQAQATPGARAIESLSYAALDAAANRLAREMLAQGAAPRAIVAVARRSSADIAVAWLAVLKAGAAYLPIDPDLPPERIAFMLADARVSHAIADEGLAGLLARPGVLVIVPEMQSEGIAAHAPEPPATDTRPEDPAYVIYTSGSTGSPKGVLIPHRAVLRLVCDTDCAPLRRDDCVAQLANPAFDASTFEFWGALLNGARIVPIPKTTAIAPRALAAAIAQEGVTALFLTTALFNAVAREAPDAFRTCRYVLFGGEAVEPRWVADVIRAGRPRHLLHVYGPTEATTFATWHEVCEVGSDALTIPIGRPLMNTEVFVLRPDLELAAPGEPGELCIGGPGLALGYLNATEQLSARFVEHAIAPLPARRIYRSGDRVRLRDDATIEFLGRHDRQVKIRGHRIELGEIEAAIVSLPQVSAAAVMVRGDTAESRQIVAYVVRADPSQPPPANLWSALRPILPDYMLPASVVWLPSLPLNASGKIDWRALPAVVASGAARPGVPVAPRDMMERVLVRIWERVLNCAGIGVYDHFFEVGGHSLLAARLVDEIERESGIAIPLAALFADDTIAGLAQVLRDGAAGLDAPIVAINAEGVLPPFVFLHGDLSGGGFYSRSLAHALGPDQPVLVVHPHGLDAAPIPDTIEAMAADRIKALRVFRPHGPYLLGGYCNGAFVAFEMARQLVHQGEDVPAVVIIEARAPAGGREPDPPAAGERYVTFDRGGVARMLMPHDRQSDAQLRFTRAIERYAGGPYAGHVVIVRSGNLDDARPDIGWARLARSSEIHVLQGDHVTIVTHQVEQLAKVARAAFDRLLARVVQ